MDTPFDASGYPDVAEYGSLAAALNVRLGAHSPQSFVRPQNRTGAIDTFIANDHSRVTVNTMVGTYHLRFSRRDWQWAVGSTPDKDLLVGAALAWLAGTGLERMGVDWPFVKFTELQLAYERGDALQTQWRILGRDATPAYREVVELAAEDPTVSRFFPTLGHNFLFMVNEFSSEILASVVFQRPGRYHLYVPDHPEAVIEGDASTVVARLAVQLESAEG